MVEALVSGIEKLKKLKNLDVKLVSKQGNFMDDKIKLLIGELK